MYGEHELTYYISDEKVCYIWANDNIDCQYVSVNSEGDYYLQGEEDSQNREKYDNSEPQLKVKEFDWGPGTAE